MIITLELAEDVANALHLRASAEGKTPERWAADCLRQVFDLDSGDDGAKPRTAAELLARWREEGLVGAWADRADIGDSAEYARALRERLQRRGR